MSLLAAFALLLLKTTAQPTPTPADIRLKGFEQRKNLKTSSILANISPVSIGPSVFSCRVTDVDVNPLDPAEIYVAYASGGLWHSKSNGTHFDPIFDHEASMTIGDIAVDWANRVIWVGTGECNSSRSSYAGTGIYRGKFIAGRPDSIAWEWRGLPESHHISRVIIHPQNPDILWVAVLGHLYSPNAERGVFKTTDGGATWRKVLFVDENSGAIDLVLDPADPNTVLAATWQRERRAWNFSGAGEGSGIWKSTDGGETFAKISTPESGFPTGAKVGRIGLCAGRSGGKTVWYASLDNQNPKPKKADDTDKKDELTKDQLRGMSPADFAKLDDDKLANFLKANDFPEKYPAKKVKEMVAAGKIQPLTLVEFLEDANANLFDVDYIGSEVYRSDDGGKTWQRTHADPIESMFFTYGYYFSTVYCDPNNAEQVYLLGFYIIRSDDGGKTWKNINGDNVHPDHHALWVNPARPGHLVNGNDGGLNISWDNGQSWTLCNNPPVGQFYAINADMAEPYNVYGGAQDNGVWVGPSNYRASTEWHQNGQYPYKSLLGGDGMQVMIDSRDNNTVYTGFQFGNYFRINKTTGDAKPIAPKHDLGERPLRFNWQTPIWLSRHNQDIIYLGANKLYRSFDRGDSWEALSADLTNGGKKGNVPYGTLTSIHESPLRFGLIYTGSDDGLVYVTRDGGETWSNISAGLPPQMWVSRVQASAHEKGRVFVSLNGYRWDDFTPYLYVSENYGQTWAAIGSDLPAEPINVVKEDPTNPNVLYVGTDHAVYVSVDRGKTFMRLGADLPATPVHDLVVQPKANDLLIGTHGRSMFKLNVAHIQQLTPEVLASAVHLFEIPKRKSNRNWGRKQPFQAAKDPELPISFYLNGAGKVRWTVKTKDGLVLNNGEWDGVKGINEFNYPLDLREEALKKYQAELTAAQKDTKKPVELKKADSGKFYLQKGKFTFELERDGKVATREFSIE
ncbi:MAG: WD40/YVTN/BNR-like repeat-containing protein [Saprospiraceae bacterium]